MKLKPFLIFIPDSQHHSIVPALHMYIQFHIYMIYLSPNPTWNKKQNITLNLMNFFPCFYFLCRIVKICASFFQSILIKLNYITCRRRNIKWCAMCMFIKAMLSVTNEQSMFFFKNWLISIVVSLLKLLADFMLSETMASMSELSTIHCLMKKTKISIPFTVLKNVEF